MPSILSATLKVNFGGQYRINHKEKRIDLFKGC